MATTPLLTLYLLVFNSASCAGWAYILYLTIRTILKTDELDEVPQHLWDVVSLPLKVVQTMAIMEIMHAALGFVRSPLGSTLLQVSSRLWLVWVINVMCPVSRYQLGFPLMVISWGLVEVPRYSFYALHLYNAVPSFLFFLRYHLFILLYPSGVLGEVLCTVSSLGFLSTGAYAIQMPNTHNISVSLYVVVILVLTLYVPGLPVMYSHMLTQRNRSYSKTKIKAA